jgi:hypothetical protein
MSGKATAVHSGAELRDKVAALGRKFGLDVRTEVRVDRRLWGAVRHIDVDPIPAVDAGGHMSASRSDAALTRWRVFARDSLRGLIRDRSDTV